MQHAVIERIAVALERIAEALDPLDPKEPGILHATRWVTDEGKWTLGDITAEVGRLADAIESSKD